MQKMSAQRHDLFAGLKAAGHACCIISEADDLYGTPCHSGGVA
jgi:phosphoserine phosphatase